MLNTNILISIIHMPDDWSVLISNVTQLWVLAETNHTSDPIELLIGLSVELTAASVVKR